MPTRTVASATGVDSAQAGRAAMAFRRDLESVMCDSRLAMTGQSRSEPSLHLSCIVVNWWYLERLAFQYGLAPPLYHDLWENCENSVPRSVLDLHKTQQQVTGSDRKIEDRKMKNA